MSDINLRAFSPEAYAGLERWCFDKDLEGMFNAWISLENAAGLFFRLREVPDSEIYFPKGKWATLQKLEELCAEAAKKAVS